MKEKFATAPWFHYLRELHTSQIMVQNRSRS
mgnify:FL=1